MPYIDPAKRERLDSSIDVLAQKLEALGSSKGDLNYAITRLIVRRLEAVGKRYDTLSDVTGVLNDVKTEFERRVVAPYEAVKIVENGDAYHPIKGIK